MRSAYSVYSSIKTNYIVFGSLRNSIVVGRWQKGFVGSYTHIAEADVLHQRRINATAHANLLEQGVDEVLERRVLEAALARLGQRRPHRQGDDDIVGILGLAVLVARQVSIGGSFPGQRCF